MDEFTHFDEKGNACMVDVSDKEVTRRTAIARGRIHLNQEAMDAVLGHRIKKGDVFTVAQIAGIMGTKRTAELIPLCHPLSMTSVTVTFEVDEKAGEIAAVCKASTDGRTGVEMEALTGVSLSLLTIYDMCKAIDRRMRITDIHLAEKSGGRSGHFIV